MYKTLQQQLQARIGALLAERYDVALANLVVELPPKIEYGEMALPVAFELAKRLKKAPRAIAQELQPSLADTPGVASVEIAGAGYLNVKLDRASVVKRMAADEHARVGCRPHGTDGSRPVPDAPCPSGSLPILCLVGRRIPVLPALRGAAHRESEPVDEGLSLASFSTAPPSVGAPSPR